MLFSDRVTQKMPQEIAEPGMVAHVCNSYIWDQKQKDCKLQVQDQPGLHTESLTQNPLKKER